MNASPLRSSLSVTTNDLLTGERTISRRAMMRGIAGLGALAVAGKLVSPAATAAQVGTARATSDLNLRSGPSTTSKVYRVIPNGATVTLNGRVQNGFQDVTYNGQPGWAHGDYLKPLSGGGGGGGGTPQPGPKGWAHTTSDLNLRSGPSTGHQVLRVMAAFAPVELLGQKQNGFLYVNHKGLAGWASADYIEVDGDQGSEPPPGQLRALSDLNLRAGASLNDKVLLVIPEGDLVTVVGGYSNNFMNVSYKGTVGWAFLDYLG